MGLLSTTHVHRHESSRYIDRDVNVTENRAPTDASIKLLKEMQQAAKDSIIDSIKIEGNFVNAVVVYFMKDKFQRQVEYEIKYSLNNVEYKISGVVSEMEFHNSVKGAYFGFRVESVAKFFVKEFTDKILISIFKQSPDFVQAVKDNKIF